jgi:hypothetical protein
MRRVVPVMIIIVLFVLSVRAGDLVADPSVQVAPASEKDVIPRQWLDRETSVEQAESENMVQGVAFGARNDAWQQLKTSLQPGDSLWTFRSSVESFRARAGRCGIALVRNGKLVKQLVTMMN